MSYTKEQVVKAIKWACGLQKADDYQVMGIKFFDAVENKTSIEDLMEDSLNHLADSDNNISGDESWIDFIFNEMENEE